MEEYGISPICEICKTRLREKIDNVHIINIVGNILVSCDKCILKVTTIMATIHQPCMYLSCNNNTNKLSIMDCPRLKIKIYKAACSNECETKIIDQDYAGPVRDIKCECGARLRPDMTMIDGLWYCPACTEKINK